METKTIDEMTEKEFDFLLDDIVEARFDKVTPKAFLEAMNALEMYQRPRVIELSGTYTDGDVLFDTPTALSVQKNTIIVGQTKIVLKLRPAEAF
jgi:hypothetical protein